MNKNVALQDFGLKDYKETWDYQEVSMPTMTEKPFPSTKGCGFFCLLELSLWVRENQESIRSIIMCKKSGPLKEEGMHAGAMADKFAFANLLRKTQTPQEEKLWEFLKIKPRGFKFRRQHPFKDYILDF